MDTEDYMHWSKSSIYLKAVRDGAVSICKSTWYKYCNLLGFKKRGSFPLKKYTSLITTRPNEFWCADVTIFKTSDGVKHYIHFLMDHFSKKILGFRIEKSNSALAIKSLLVDALSSCTSKDDIKLLTDGGSENVNRTVADLLKMSEINIKQVIAQKDIKFSNSMIEALNKVIKHQFLLPLQLASLKQLLEALTKAVEVYNNERPQFNLGGNTPSETYSGIPIDFSQYSIHFKEQKLARLAQNKKNTCNSCSKV